MVDFTQTLVLMTSNLRNEDEVRGRFRPEFINRLDEVVAYEPLERAQIAKIVDVQLCVRSADGPSSAPRVRASSPWISGTSRSAASVAEG